MSTAEPRAEARAEGAGECRALSGECRPAGKPGKTSWRLDLPFWTNRASAS